MAGKKTTNHSAANSGRSADGRFSKNNPHRFKKGVSGNPSGRPIDSITPHLREIVQERYPGRSETTYGRLIAQALVSQALDGEVMAIREVIDRLEGRPRQAIDLSIDERKRNLTERAIEALMTDAGIDREEAIEELTRLNPEVTTWIH